MRRVDSSEHVWSSDPSVFTISGTKSRSRCCRSLPIKCRGTIPFSSQTGERKSRAPKSFFTSFLFFFLPNLKIPLKADYHVKFYDMKNFLFSHPVSLRFQNASLCVFKSPSWVLHYVWTSS